MTEKNNYFGGNFEGMNNENPDDETNINPSKDIHVPVIEHDSYGSGETSCSDSTVVADMKDDDYLNLSPEKDAAPLNDFETIEFETSTKPHNRREENYYKTIGVEDDSSSDLRFGSSDDNADGGMDYNMFTSEKDNIGRNNLKDSRHVINLNNARRANRTSISDSTQEFRGKTIGATSNIMGGGGDSRSGFNLGPPTTAKPEKKNIGPKHGSGGYTNPPAKNIGGMSFGGPIGPPVSPVTTIGRDNPEQNGSSDYIRKIDHKVVTGGYGGGNDRNYQPNQNVRNAGYSNDRTGGRRNYQQSNMQQPRYQGDSGSGFQGDSSSGFRTIGRSNHEQRRTIPKMKSPFHSDDADADADGLPYDTHHESYGRKIGYNQNQNQNGGYEEYEDYRTQYHSNMQQQNRGEDRNRSRGEDRFRQPPQTQTQNRTGYRNNYERKPKYFEKVKVVEEVEEKFIVGDTFFNWKVPSGKRVKILLWGYPGSGKKCLLDTFASTKDQIQRIHHLKRNVFQRFNFGSGVSVFLPWNYNPEMYDSNGIRRRSGSSRIETAGKAEYKAFKDIILGKVPPGCQKGEYFRKMNDNISMRQNPENMIDVILFCVDIATVKEDLRYLAPFVDFVEKKHSKTFSMLVTTKVDVLLDKVEKEKLNIGETPYFEGRIINYKKHDHAEQYCNSESTWENIRDNFIKALKNDTLKGYPMVSYAKDIMYPKELIFRLSKAIVHAIGRRINFKVKKFELDLFKDEKTVELGYKLDVDRNPVNFTSPEKHLQSRFYDEVRNQQDNDVSRFVKANIILDVFHKTLEFAFSTSFKMKARFFVASTTALKNSQIMGCLIPRDFLVPVPRGNCLTGNNFDYDEEDDDITIGGISNLKESQFQSDMTSTFDIEPPKAEDPFKKPVIKKKTKERTCIYFECEIDKVGVIDNIESACKQEDTQVEFEFIDERLENSSRIFRHRETYYLRLTFGPERYILTRTPYLDVHKKIEEFIQKEKKNKNVELKLEALQKYVLDFEKKFVHFQNQVQDFIDKPIDENDNGVGNNV